MLTTKFSMGIPKSLDINQSVLKKINLWKSSKFWYVNIYYSHIGFGKWSLACFGAKYPPADDFFAQSFDQNLQFYSIILKKASTHRKLIKSAKHGVKVRTLASLPNKLGSILG